MDVTVTQRGAGFDELARRARLGLRNANRDAGRRIAKVGRQAMAKGAPRMFGRKLAVKAKTSASAASAEVSFTPAKRQSGLWAIAESGASPHPIRPRRATALAFNGRFAAHVAHPGTAGHQAWTRAGERLEAAVAPVVDDTMGDAFDA